MKKAPLSFMIVLFCCLIMPRIPGAWAGNASLSSDEIYTRIVKNLEAKDFHQADATLGELLKSKRLSVDGRRTLEEVYRQFKKYHDEKTFDEWCAKSTTTHFAYVIRGAYLLDKASEVRGWELARNVKERQWQDMRAFLQRAEADLQKAYAMDPSDPQSAASMTHLCLLKGYPRAVMEKWFDRAIGADDFWLDAYTAKLNFLMPQWYGSLKEEMDFFKYCFDKSPKGSAVYSVVLGRLSLLVDFHKLIEPGYILVSWGLDPELRVMIVKVLKQYHKDFPQSSRADYFEGLFKHLTSDTEGALVCYQKALRKRPRFIPALEAECNALILLGRRQEADKQLNRLLQMEPNLPFALINLGVSRIVGDNDDNKGIELFKKAVTNETNPYYQKYYWYSLANILCKKENYGPAITFYTKALGIDPYFARALMRRGQCKHDSGDIDGAIADMMAIQQFDNTHKETAKKLADKYMDEGKQASRKHEPAPPRSTYSKTGTNQDIHTADIRVNESEQPAKKISNKSIDQQYSACEEYYFRKLKNKATDCLANLLLEAPNYAPTYYLLGKIAENLEYDYAKSANYFGVAVSKDHKNDKYILSLGNSLYIQRKFDQAIPVLGKLIEMSPKMGKAYYLRGLCFDATGNTEKAIQDMQLAYLYDPGLEDANRYVEEHVQIKPPEPKISKVDQLLMLAEGNMRVQRYNEAEKEFEEILQLNPKNDYAQFRLGILYIDRDRDHKKAIDYFDKAIALNKKYADYYLNRGWALQFLGQYSKAIDDFSHGIALKPESGSFYSNRGECYEKIEEWKKAEKDYQSAIKYSEGNKDYYYSKLARISMKTGSKLKFNRDNIPLLVDRGRAYVAKKEYSLAKKDFLHAIKLNPSDPASYYELGTLYAEKLHDTTNALNYLSKAIEKDKGNRDYVFKRGLVLFNLKEYAKAKKDFSQAIQLKPEAGQTYYYRGQCNRKLGLKDQARDDYLNAKKFDPSWSGAVNHLLEEMM